MIAQGAIGKVNLMMSFGGQGLPNYSSHQTDMFRYLLSDVECRWVMGNVERKTDRFERTTRIEDRAVAFTNLRTVPGARFSPMSQTRSTRAPRSTAPKARSH